MFTYTRARSISLGYSEDIAFCVYEIVQQSARTYRYSEMGSYAQIDHFEKP